MLRWKERYKAGKIIKKKSQTKIKGTMSQIKKKIQKFVKGFRKRIVIAKNKIAFRLVILHAVCI